LSMPARESPAAAGPISGVELGLTTETDRLKLKEHPGDLGGGAAA
jgi:hypothetical protein